MAQETLVVFINLVIDESLLAHQLAVHALLESLDNLLQDRLVEDHLLAAHAARHITTGEQFAALQDDSVASGIQRIHPKLLVENLARKDEHLHVGILLLGAAADFHANGGRTAQSQIEQHEVGLLRLDKSPVSRFVFGSSYDFCLRNVGLEDALGTFQLQWNIFYYNHFKILHISILFLVFLFNSSLRFLMLNFCYF